MTFSARNRPYSGLTALGMVVVVVSALYAAKEFIVPLVFAALLAFLLSPLVRFLCRKGLPRALAIILVTVFVFSFLGVLIWMIGQQAANLASQLPNYTGNIKKRIESVQKLRDNQFLKNLHKIAQDLQGPQQAQNQSEAAANQAPQPPANPGFASRFMNTVIEGLGGAVGTGAIVIVYVLFMLLRQEDISQRIVRLAGYNRLTTTTRALDEAAGRVSHYLLMQTTVNGIYGALLASCMAVVGLPYIALWGTLGAVFRYIPYIGPIAVSVLPIGFSFAYFDGWASPLMVAGIILLLELATNMVLEPILYGRSAGVSDFALIVAITFWTWLWGGIGLVVATPMTVCIVVICKYIPRLEWVEMVMGDSVKPNPYLDYYQEVISGQDDIALDAVEDSAGKSGTLFTVEEKVLPALCLIRREFLRGSLSIDERDDALRQIGKAAEVLNAAKPRTGPPVEVESADEVATEEEPHRRVSVFARALHGETDALALKLLQSCLPTHVLLDISSEPHLIGELISELEAHKPDIVCISATPPEADTAASILCRRIRSRLPNLKILVCYWDAFQQDLDIKPLQEAGATAVAKGVSQAAELITKLTERR